MLKLSKVFAKTIQSNIYHINIQCNAYKVSIYSIFSFSTKHLGHTGQNGKILATINRHLHHFPFGLMFFLYIFKNKKCNQLIFEEWNASGKWYKIIILLMMIGKKERKNYLIYI
jgi:hypothetical protein